MPIGKKTQPNLPYNPPIKKKSTYRWLEVGFGFTEYPHDEEMEVTFGSSFDEAIQTACAMVKVQVQGMGRMVATNPAINFYQTPQKRQDFVNNLLVNNPIIRRTLLRLITKTWRTSLPLIVQEAARKLQSGLSVAPFVDLVKDGFEFLISSLARTFVQSLGSYRNVDAILQLRTTLSAEKNHAHNVADTMEALLEAVIDTINLPDESQLKFVTLSDPIRLDNNPTLGPPILPFMDQGTIKECFG